MDITPGLPGTDNFQHWPPWRQLVVETARRVLDSTGDVNITNSAGFGHGCLP